MVFHGLQAVIISANYSMAQYTNNVLIIKAHIHVYGNKLFCEIITNGHKGQKYTTQARAHTCTHASMEESGTHVGLTCKKFAINHNISK
jgi:hypothetical protein